MKPRFEIEIIGEYGTKQALFGLGLSHGVTSKESFHFADFSKIQNVGKRLFPLGKGHNQFAKMIFYYFDITAARYWWQEFSKYHVGVEMQSESTMHTLNKRKLAQKDFAYSIGPGILKQINDMVGREELETIKNSLPEGFLQRRVICCSLMALKNIYEQREEHKLEEWKMFCRVIKPILDEWRE